MCTPPWMGCYCITWLTPVFNLPLTFCTWWREALWRGSYGPWKTWKVLEFIISISKPGKLWNLSGGHAKLWNLKNLKEYQLCFVSFIQPIRYWICQSVTHNSYHPHVWPVARLFPLWFQPVVRELPRFLSVRQLFPSLSLWTFPSVTRFSPRFPHYM